MLLIKLAFIKQTTAVEKEDAQGQIKEDESAGLVLKIWQELEGEKNNGITSDNLRIFSGAIMKILLSPEIETKNKTTYGGFTEEGSYSINQAQAKKIHKDFNLLYINRKSYNTSSTSSKPQEEADCSFKPVICEKSAILAGNLREKIASN